MCSSAEHTTGGSSLRYRLKPATLLAPACCWAVQTRTLPPSAETNVTVSAAKRAAAGTVSQNGSPDRLFVWCQGWHSGHEKTC